MTNDEILPMHVYGFLFSKKVQSLSVILGRADQELLDNAIVSLRALLHLAEVTKEKANDVETMQKLADRARERVRLITESGATGEEIALAQEKDAKDAVRIQNRLNKREAELEQILGGLNTILIRQAYNTREAESLANTSPLKLKP